jgi:hypothetical protein
VDCDLVQSGNIIERYLSGSLDPKLLEQWEAHYFACPSCAQLLETWQAVERPLRDAAPRIRREIEARRTGRVWAAAAIAAALVVALGIGLMRRPAADRPHAVVAVRQLPALANLEPAAYEETPMRGVPTRAETLFREAMRHYQARDWVAASEGLRASLQQDAASPAPRFFLGISLMLAGRIAEGAHELDAVASGGSPFAEEARFNLSKGYLWLGRREDALNELGKVVAGQGDFARPAHALQAALNQ